MSPNNSIDPFKLIPGEYVVHRKFGIGKFLGIRSIAVDAAPVNATTGETVGPAPKIGFLFIECGRAGQDPAGESRRAAVPLREPRRAHLA